MIVTGDSLLTACHVAAEVGLLSPITRPEKGASRKKGSARKNRNAVRTVGKPSLLLTVSGDGVSLDATFRRLYCY